MSGPRSLTPLFPHLLHNIRSQLSRAGIYFGILIACTMSACTGPDPAGPAEDTTEVATADPPQPATAPADPVPASPLSFEQANEIGMNLQHNAGRSPQKFMPETLGGGVLVADFNRDFAADLLFLNSGAIASDGAITPAPHRLYLNQGDGTFTDETDAWKLRNLGYGMGGAVGDIDNDGWPDVYLTTFDGQDQMLRNTGSGFEDVTELAGILNDGSWSSSAGFFDMDHDGDLDLYVVKYVQYDPTTALPCFSNGFQIYCNPVMFDPQRDFLYENDGNGRFQEVGEARGVPAFGKGLALTLGDVDRDGDTDAYVANDTTSNFLLINDGTGNFQDQASLLGVGQSPFGKEEAGMGVDFADVNQDGLPDIVCTNFQSETTSVYVQHPDGYFIERSDEIGIGRTARQRLSFGVDFFDADNDGDDDLLVANGHIYAEVAEFETGTTFGQLNTLYERQETGFVDVTASAGPALQKALPSRGLATGDLDQDGDIDFVVVNNDSSAEVGRNSTAPKGNSIVLWLEGAEATNRSAIGAVVTAKAGELEVNVERVGASSYLSACAPHIHLGIGAATEADEVMVAWPGGQTQSVSGLAAGYVYHWRQNEDPVMIRPFAATSRGTP